MPSIVSEFLAQLELRFEKKPYLFYAATYGTTRGASAAMADRIMREKGLPFDACFDIKMPDIWTPIFDLANPEHVRGIIEGSDKEIAEVKGQIDEKVTGRQMVPTTPYFTGVIGKALHDGYTRKTSHLSVADSCIGCGLCARKCPAHTIEVQDGTPVWTKERCIMCLGCLHRCPKFAVSCGKGTARHDQYVNPYTRI